MFSLVKTYAIHALVIALIAACGTAAWQYTNVLGLKAALSEEKRERAAERETAAVQLAATEKEYRQIEAARENARTKDVDIARKETNHANTVADAALRERDLLRKQVTQLTARLTARRADAPARPATAAGGSPATPAGGLHTGPDSPGTDAIELLGRLFAESDETSGELAKAVGESRVAGLTCERLYDKIYETQ